MPILSCRAQANSHKRRSSFVHLVRLAPRGDVPTGDHFAHRLCQIGTTTTRENCKKKQPAALRSRIAAGTLVSMLQKTDKQKTSMQQHSVGPKETRKLDFPMIANYGCVQTSQFLAAYYAAAKHTTHAWPNNYRRSVEIEKLIWMSSTEVSFASV